MAAWDKIKFFYDTMFGSPGSTLTASSTESSSDYDIDYLYNMLETNFWKATSSADQTLTFDAQSGFCTNGDFETGDASGWTIGFNPGDGAAGSSAVISSLPYRGTYCLKVTITNGGNSAGDVQVYSDMFSVVKGRTYVVRYALKADSARTVTAECLKAVHPWTVIGVSNAEDLTSSWQHFEYTFVSTYTGLARFYIHMGDSTINVYLDDLAVYEESAVVADFIVIAGHNVGTVSGNFKLEYSDTGAWGGEEVVAIENIHPFHDGIRLEEFTKTAPHRYWKITMAGAMNGAPYMATCTPGLKTELGYASEVYAPDREQDSKIVNVTQDGYVSGIHTKYTRRIMNFRLFADPITYAKVEDWRSVSGVKNFFVAHDTANSPTKVSLMRPDDDFNNPLDLAGVYRHVTINLVGRKE